MFVKKLRGSVGSSELGIKFLPRQRTERFEKNDKVFGPKREALHPHRREKEEKRVVF